MSTYPHHPQRPHDTGSLFTALIVAMVAFILITLVTL
jgi:hypothetical protein